MEAASKRHFFHHGKDNAREQHIQEVENCHLCQIRSFDSHGVSPISIINELDGCVLPNDFRFIDQIVLGAGVQPAEDSFRSGCDCGDDDQCQDRGCDCLADMEQEKSGSEEDEDARDGENRKVYSYYLRGRHAGLLRDKLLDSKSPLYECHQGCQCSHACPNRVVERGRVIPLQIFRTENRGWGVRSQTPIRKGQFVDRYIGEIITSAEADRRRAISAFSKRKDVYLFALDKFTDPKSLDHRLRGPPLEVDGEFVSGPTRFINHSCDPNLRIFARVGDHADKHIHDLALFAIRDICSGEELTFDYVDGVIEETDDIEGGLGDMTNCLCGSENCRKFLW